MVVISSSQAHGGFATAAISAKLGCLVWREREYFANSFVMVFRDWIVPCWRARAEA
jgi:hypothetical protein